MSSLVGAAVGAGSAAVGRTEGRALGPSDGGKLGAAEDGRRRGGPGSGGGPGLGLGAGNGLAAVGAKEQPQAARPNVRAAASCAASFRFWAPASDPQPYLREECS